MHWIPRFYILSSPSSLLFSFKSASSSQEKKKKKFWPKNYIHKVRLIWTHNTYKKNVSSSSLLVLLYSVVFLLPLFFSLFLSLTFLYWLYCYSSDADALTTTSNTLNVPSTKGERRFFSSPLFGNASSSWLILCLYCSVLFAIHFLFSFLFSFSLYSEMIYCCLQTLMLFFFFFFYYYCYYLIWHTKKWPTVYNCITLGHKF